MLQIKSFSFNPFAENTYILNDESSEAVIIDPGCYEKDEKYELSDFVEKTALQPVMVLNTHCHIDHVLGNAFVKNAYKIPLLFHQNEEPVLRAVTAYASNYGFPLYQVSHADQYIKEGEAVRFGNTTLQA